jgi:hypothetical protein
MKNANLEKALLSGDFKIKSGGNRSRDYRGGGGLRDVGRFLVHQKML